jgi:broad specificity phosphatase PhoE
MPLIALLRHGPTEWNAAKRLQGRVDPPLSAPGRAEVGRRRLPADLDGWRLVSSPLRRVVETALILAGEPVIEPRLIEMDWGAWEGETVADLRARLGPAMAENEARGLDFRPDGGESPREVQARLQPWLDELAAGGDDTVAVTHKGVIRALYARATGWDMTGRMPDKLDWRMAHLFRVEATGLDGTGAIVPHRLNLPLGERLP